jgi:hypothetical protein
VPPPASEPCCADEAEPLLELDPMTPCESPALEIAAHWGSPAIAQDAPVTTRRPVATAAAGRSHPNHPTRP